jgi:hypothetical protein
MPRTQGAALSQIDLMRYYAATSAESLEVLNMDAEKAQFGRIVTIISRKRACTAAPVEVLAEVGGSISVQNLTDDTVILFFPNAELFGQSTIELDSGEEMTLTVGDVSQGTYPYNVFCKNAQVFADKAATPRVIVYKTPLQSA